MDNKTPSDQTGLGVSQQVANDVGNRLRLARETSGKTSQMIAQKVKIREPYLFAIEQGFWNELPPGLNGRGLVRIYARELSVPVPELEPKSSTMLQNQGDPVPAVQVVSRNAIVERELSRASLDLVKSVPCTPNTALNNPQSHRTSFNPPKRTPIPRPVPAAPLNAPVLPTPVPYTPSSFPSRASERDDEEPLDVITPDVASILGISFDQLPEVPEQSARQPTPATSAIVAAPTSGIKPENTTNNAEQQAVHAERFAQQDEPTLQAPTQAQSFSEPPATVAMDSINSTAAVSTAAEEREQQEEQVRADAAQDYRQSKESKKNKHKKEHRTGASSESSEVPVLTAHSTTSTTSSAGSDSAPPESQPVSHLFKNHTGKNSEPAALVAEGHSSAAAAVAVASKKQSRNIFIYAAAAVVFVAAGAVFFSAKNKNGEQTQGHGTVLNNAGNTGAADSATQNPDSTLGVQAVPEVPPDASNAQALTSQPGGLGAVPDAAPVGASIEAVVTPQGGGVVEQNTPPVTANSEKVVPNSGSQIAPEAASTVSVAAQAPLKAEDAAAAAAAAAAPVKTAKLNILEDVELQVVADGKKVFSGTRPVGNFDVKFKKQAEILVQDGSRVKLTFGTWEHGLLGHVGRKRKIVLNAEPFNSDMNN